MKVRFRIVFNENHITYFCNQYLFRSTTRGRGSKIGLDDAHSKAEYTGMAIFADWQHRCDCGWCFFANFRHSFWRILWCKLL